VTFFDFDAMVDAAGTRLDDGTFAAPSGYESCRSAICVTSDVDSVARAVLQAAGVPDLLAMVRTVRDHHVPAVTKIRGIVQWVACPGCPETPHGPAEWPCGTAKVVYSAEEVSAILSRWGLLAS
jgi:hypothetical protein